jgi:hypothetical protein
MPGSNADKKCYHSRFEADFVQISVERGRQLLGALFRACMPSSIPWIGIRGEAAATSSKHKAQGKGPSVQITGLITYVISLFTVCVSMALTLFTSDKNATSL